MTKKKKSPKKKSGNAKTAEGLSPKTKLTTEKPAQNAEAKASSPSTGEEATPQQIGELLELLVKGQHQQQQINKHFEDAINQIGSAVNAQKKAVQTIKTVDDPIGGFLEKHPELEAAGVALMQQLPEILGGLFGGGEPDISDELRKRAYENITRESETRTAVMNAILKGLETGAVQIVRNVRDSQSPDSQSPSGENEG